MAKLREEHVRLAREMVARSVSVRQVAADLGVDESTVRYHLARPSDATDGRRDRPSVLDGWSARVAAVVARFSDTPPAATVVHEVLVREFGFPGSYQAVRRWLRRQAGPPRVQAVRRVETPAGVQAQHDWFTVEVAIAGVPTRVYGLIGTLSHSRARFVWVSPTMTQLAWQTGHLALFQRYGGVPLWVRIDNLKTAVATGGGPTAALTPAFATFARACGFGVDVCRVRTPQDKGKIERSVSTTPTSEADLWTTDWTTLGALQAALDARATERAMARMCPITGTSVAVAHAAEARLLQPLPTVHEPFDCVVARRVSRDALVSFEGRRYSVPFAWLGHTVEVRGTADAVVVLAGGAEVARHPRRTMRRLVLEPTHYEGPDTPAVRAPVPLGHRARLQLAGLPPTAVIARPLDAYIALVQEAWL